MSSGNHLGENKQNPIQPPHPGLSFSFYQVYLFGYRKVSVRRGVHMRNSQPSAGQELPLHRSVCVPRALCDSFWSRCAEDLDVGRRWEPNRSAHRRPRLRFDAWGHQNVHGQERRRRNIPSHWFRNRTGSLQIQRLIWALLYLAFF